jgi:type I restriction enzyme M protein
MALKKSDLYSALWEACDELRGGMDASQYKDYVLVLLFMKYVSDKYADKKGALLDIPKGARYADLVTLKGDKEIGDKMNKVIGKLADANDLRGVIDVADFNDSDKLGKGKEMVERLSNLIAVFDRPELDFKGNDAQGDDLLGDAYEYLMRHFATESGKSKGQFYTPAEVSRVMAKVIGIDSATSASQTIDDPTCGSGSLLLKAHAEAKNATGKSLTLYGQEMDNATSALAKMNMILHDCPTAEIQKGNVLADPQFKNRDGSLKQFDFCVANPPFSFKAWTSGFDPAHDEFGRFELGVPPAKNGDMAFLLHILTTLKSTGKAAVNLPHGVLFRGNAEADIRKQLIQRGYIKGIIGLPANLFYGTGIPACIVVLDKEGADSRKGIFMLDASKGFVKDGNKNRLREQDIHKIVDTFNREVDVAGYSRMVPLKEIEANDFNLNLPRYIDSSEPEDIQDIDGHLNGGIPDRDIDGLELYWKVLPSVRGALFEPAGRPGYSKLRVPAADIKQTIFEHPEFAAFNKSAAKIFESWVTDVRPRLAGIKKGDKPKQLIHEISEALLEKFCKGKLLDPYDVYQHLMTYWAETMQDDAYMLVQDGWVAEPARIVEVDKKGKAKDKGWDCSLIPKPLAIARYFANEQAAIDAKQAELDAVSASLTELEEEHGGDEGLLVDAMNDKDKVTKASVKSRLTEIKKDATAADERAVLERYLELAEQESEASRQVKDATETLDGDAAKKYGKLTTDEIKQLVLDDKWLASIREALHGELDRASQTLSSRVRDLAERYASPLPVLAREVGELTSRVETHLKKMGASWK